MQNSNNNMPRVLPQNGFGRVECTDLTPTSKVERFSGRPSAQYAELECTLTLTLFSKVETLFPIDPRLSMQNHALKRNLKNNQDACFTCYTFWLFSVHNPVWVLLIVSSMHKSVNVESYIPKLSTYKNQCNAYLL